MIEITGLDHLVLTIRDIDRTIAFYSGVLGMRAVTFGAGRTALTRQDLPIEGVGTGLRLSWGDWPAEAESQAPDAAVPVAAPDWALRMAPPAPDFVGPVTASGLGGAKVLAGTSAGDRDAAMLRGTRLHLLLEHLPAHTASDWPRIAYRDSLKWYGSDKPDLRFGQELVDVTEYFGDTPFRVFQAPYVGAVVMPGGASQPRRQFDAWQDWAKQRGAKGLAYVTVGEDGELGGPVAKNISDDEKAGLAAHVGAQPGDCIFFAAGEAKQARALLGAAGWKTRRRARSDLPASDRPVRRRHRRCLQGKPGADRMGVGRGGRQLGGGVAAGGHQQHRRVAGVALCDH